MSQNDEQIKKLLGVIEEKRKKLGKKPRMTLKTNGVLKIDNAENIFINTINTIEKCIQAVSYLVNARKAYVEAAKLLDVDYEMPKSNGFSVEDWIEDFKLKANVIKWELEDKKIKALESKLKNLRSEDLKTADALSDIAKTLDV